MPLSLQQLQSAVDCPGCNAVTCDPEALTEVLGTDTARAKVPNTTRQQHSTASARRALPERQFERE